MNETIKIQQAHRTIRFFKEKAISPDINQQIYDVINRTATSNGLQSYSVIRVTDPAKRQALAKICNQAYVEKAPEYLLFLVDAKRNAEIAKAKGYTGEKYRSMDFFFQGAADVYLAAQNATIAIESLGLGAVYFGSVLNDSQSVVDLFDLPPLTFPLLGLGYGYPDDQPELKPRMPFEQKIGENSYPYFDDIVSELSDYDREMTQYYDTRNKNKRVDAFTDQVKQRIEIASPLRAQMMCVVEKQGFDLGLDNK